MKQYILNGKNSIGQINTHIEDYRTKEKMEQEFSHIKKTFKNNPFVEVFDEQERSFKAKSGGVIFEYYITEREIDV